MIRPCRATLWHFGSPWAEIEFSRTPGQSPEELRPSWEVYLVARGRRVFVRRLQGLFFPVPEWVGQFRHLVKDKLDQIARGVA